MALLNFKSGLQAGLANAAFSAGTVYVTEDTKKLYVDLQNKSSVADGRICIGDFQLVKYSTGTAQEALNALTIKEDNVLYVTVGPEDATGLWRCENNAFKSLSSSTDVVSLRGDVTALQSTTQQHGVDIAKNAGDISKNAGDIAKNTGDIAKNAGDIAKNAEDVAKNKTDIASNLTKIEKNASDITAISTTVTTIEPLAKNAMPKTGGDFTGAVTVLAPTADSNPVRKVDVDTALTTLKGGFTGTLKDISEAAAAADGKAVAANTAAGVADEKAVNAQKAADAAAKAASDADAKADTKAPIMHAAEDATYGLGSASAYGHVKLSSAVDSTYGPESGFAATPSAVKAAYDAATGAQTTANAAMPKSGGTFSNHISIPVTPTEEAHAASKKYVDSAAATAKSEAIVDAQQKVNGVIGAEGDAATANTIYGAKAAAKAAADAASAAQSTADAAMPKAGGSFTGEVFVLAPTAETHAATKKYVDDAAAATLNSAKADATTKANAVMGTADDAATKDTVLGLRKAITALQTNIDNLANTMDFLGVTTSDVAQGATITSIVVNEKTVNVVAGDVVIKGGKEFVFDGSAWQEIGDATALGAAIDGLDGRLDTAEGKIADLETWKGTHATAFSELSETVAGHTTSINSHNTRIEAVETASGKNATDIGNLTNRVKANEDNISELRADLGNDDGKGAIFTRMASAESSIDGINSAIGAPVAEDAGKKNGTLYERIQYNHDYCADLHTMMTWGSF